MLNIANKKYKLTRDSIKRKQTKFKPINFVRCDINKKIPIIGKINMACNKVRRNNMKGLTFYRI